MNAQDTPQGEQPPPPRCPICWDTGIETVECPQCSGRGHITVPCIDCSGTGTPMGCLDQSGGLWQGGEGQGTPQAAAAPLAPPTPTPPSEILIAPADPSAGLTAANPDGSITVDAGKIKKRVFERPEDAKWCSACEGQGTVQQWCAPDLFVACTSCRAADGISNKKWLSGGPGTGGTGSAGGSSSIRAGGGGQQQQPGSGARRMRLVIRSRR